MANSGFDNIVTLNVNELNLEQINPNTDNINNPSQGGSKIVVIGKPGTGKTTLITDLLYHKKHIFPIGLVFSGTEDSNGHYSKMFPANFVYNKLELPKVEDFIQRQKLAKQHLDNPWSILLLDDCTDDPRVFNDPLFQGLFKNGRHWKMLFILSLQHCMDVKPVIRTNVDCCFIFAKQI